MVTDEYVAKKYLNILYRAQKKKLDFDLSLIDIRRLLNKKYCSFSGILLVLPEKHLSAKDIVPDDYPTIDRIDNSLGYIKGNVCTVCSRVNKQKGNLTTKEITNMYKAIQGMNNTKHT